MAKRENFRAAFANFDFDEVAKFSPNEIENLLGNKGIVRHRGKIEAVINNAKRAQELVAEADSLARFVWSFEPDPGTLPRPQSQSTSKESVALSKALKKRGWTFVGPTTAFAFMQAMGLINDHAIGCCQRERADALRKSFERPPPPSLP